MDFNDLVFKLMRNLNFGMAFEICRFLDYDDDIVYKKFCAYYIKKQKNNFYNLINTFNFSSNG